MIIYFVLFLIVLILAIFNYSNYVNKLEPNTNPSLLFKFKTEFRFDDSVKDWEIDLTKDKCMGETLCNTSEVFSCKNCQSSLAKCVHLSVDTKAVLAGREVILPANKNINEGYCLHIVKLTERCSLHGDLVLVTINPENPVYFLLCICKNPGIIGNNRIDGDCTTPFVCDGKVEDVYVPVNEIKCICNQGYVPVVGNFPYCRASNFKQDKFNEAEWSDVKKDKIQNFSEILSKTIKKYQNSSMIPTPCGTCPFTHKPVPFGLINGTCTELSGHKLGHGVPMTLQHGKILEYTSVVSVALDWASIMMFPGVEGVGMFVVYECFVNTPNNKEVLKHILGKQMDSMIDDKIYIRSPNVVLGYDILRGHDLRLLTAIEIVSHDTDPNLTSVWSAFLHNTTDLLNKNYWIQDCKLTYQHIAKEPSKKFPFLFGGTMLFCIRKMLSTESGIFFNKLGIINNHATPDFKKFKFSGIKIFNNGDIRFLWYDDDTLLDRRIYLGADLGDNDEAIKKLQDLSKF